MAFASFTPLAKKPKQLIASNDNFHCLSRCPLHASISSNGNNNNKINRFFRNSNNNNQNSNSKKFESFDGSQPLLPPWRPESLEQAFNHASSRISSRENPKIQPELPQTIISLKVTNSESKITTMFASVIQAVDHGDKHRVWLRPLLLDASVGGFVDLRGTSDLLLDQYLVGDKVDEITRMKLRVNLTATECDLYERTADVIDGLSTQVASDALVQFLSRLHQQHHPLQETDSDNSTL